MASNYQLFQIQFPISEVWDKCLTTAIVTQKLINNGDMRRQYDGHSESLFLKKKFIQLN